MKTATAHTSVGTSEHHTGPVCERCGGFTFERLQRTGFLQRRIMPFFHRYPWRCVLCNKLTYRTARNNLELRKLASR